MKRLQSIVLAICMALLVVAVASPLTAQAADEAFIVVLEPAEWTGEGVRSVPQPVGRSLRIRGLAYHPSGIASVHVNGQRAVVVPSGDGGQIEFIVNLPVTAGTEEAFFVAAVNEGSPIIVSRSLDLLPADAIQDTPGPEQRFNRTATRWAVVIGLSAYEDSAIPSLRFAHRDAEALRDFLISEGAGLGGFDPEKVVLLTNEQATFRNIRTALRGFLTSATEDDQIVFYFAGHGVRDPARPGEYYLLTYDTEFDNLPGTALPMSDLEQSIAGLSYRDLIFLADACHSGDIGTQVAFRDAFGYNDINDVFRERFQASRGGEVVFTAGEGRDLSQEGERWGGGHGVFTYHLLQGLEGAADVNRDGIVELGELLEYVRENVRRDTGNAQTPAIAGASFDRYLPVGLVRNAAVAEAPTPPVGVQPVVATDPPTAVAQTDPPLPEEEGEPDDEAPTAEGAPAFTPEGALGRGLVFPGFGQLHTGRTLQGAVVLGAVAGAAGLAARSEVVTEQRTFQGPFGGTYQEEVQVVDYPYRTLGIGIAGAIAVAGAMEAFFYARGGGHGQGSRDVSLRLEIGGDASGGIVLGMQAPVTVFPSLRR